MAITMTKINKFMESLAAGIAGNLFTGSTDVFKIALVKDSPAAMKVFADLTNECTGGGSTGYTAGGNAAAFSSGAVTAGTLKLVLTSPTAWTAGADTLANIRYAVLYNSTPAAKPLFGFYDYGSLITLAAGETLTVTLDGAAGVLTIA